MPDLTASARTAAAQLRSAANVTDHVDEEEQLRDLAQLLDRLAEDRDAAAIPTPDDYQGQARAIVRAYVEEQLALGLGVEQAFDVYVVWFVKALRNWKALVSTTIPDGRYYEVTHNGDAGETYLDAYVKLENRVVR